MKLHPILTVSLFKRYKLSKFDANYEKYLAACGIPSLVVSILVTSGFNEIIHVQAPEKLQTGVWTWTVTKRESQDE